MSQRGRGSSRVSNHLDESVAGPSTSLVSAPRHSELVNSLTRTMLLKDQSKEPFRKAEITRLAAGLTSHKVDPLVWTHAERKLKDSLGLILKQLEEPYDGLYILVKEIRSPIFESNASLNPSIHDGLLVIVLGVIFMSGNSIEEPSLMSLLDDLAIFQTDQVLLPGNNKVTVKDLLSSIWKKQMYLEIKQLRNQKRTFEWGQRAHIEISKPEILGLMARIMNSRPEQWREQYRVAYGRDPGRTITANNVQLTIRPLHTASTSQSRGSITQEITVVDDGNDDDEIQIVSQPSSQGRAPLRPRNLVETFSQVRQSRHRR